MRRLFWKSSEQRLRSGWRLLVFLALVALFANPLVLLLDTTNIRILESSLENVCVAIGFLIALLISARYFERRSLSDFGLESSLQWWREFGYGLLAGVAVMFLVLVGLSLSSAYSWQLAFQTSFSGIPFWVGFFAQSLRYFAGSFFEELFSRGYLLRMFSEGGHGLGLSPQGAVLLATFFSSALFAALHLANPAATPISFLNLLLLGILFTLPVLFTGRLGMSIGLHMAWNVMQNNVLGLANSGKPSLVSILAPVDMNNRDFGGGDFGPEGGWVVTIVLVLILSPILAHLIKSPARISRRALALAARPGQSSALRLESGV